MGWSAQAVDVMGYLRQNRIIFVGEPITDKVRAHGNFWLVRARFVAQPKRFDGPGKRLRTGAAQVYCNSSLPPAVP
jgi:hypothetical protein